MEIDLKNLTDKQKTLLTKFAYADIDMDKFNELTKSGKIVTISDLKYILKNPNQPYVGKFVSDKFINVFSSIQPDKLSTQFKLIEELEKEGLGKLEIKDIQSSKNNGFYAIAFSDSKENIGITYRGTDLNTFIQDMRN